MTSYKTKKTPGNTAWFTHDKFGMFIHFGLYALPARGEWVKTAEEMTDEKYNEYFEEFNPDMYDPKEWARQAKAAGMKYAVMTAKHHDGFCLFDSKYTEYKSTNTPCGKDLIKEYADAFRAEGLRVGLYYSLIDWNHPDFTIDHLHPRRSDANAEELDKGRDMKKYNEYMRNQVEEILTNYGKIDIIWFDFSYDMTPGGEYYKEQWRVDRVKPWMHANGGKGKNEWEAEKLIALVRKLQPEIIIDNRTEIDQDIWTPEQYQPIDWLRDAKTNENVVWEACQTFSGSWGYHRDELTWKSPEILINMLINTVSCGGNLLMNVGPTARGYLDYRAEDALKVYSEWMKYNSDSIYGCTMAEPEFVAPEGTKLTQSVDSKRLYIHLQTYPFGLLAMNGLAGKIKSVRFLHDRSEILYTEGHKFYVGGDRNVSNSDVVTFELPFVKPNTIVPVIEVLLK